MAKYHWLDIHETPACKGGHVVVYIHSVILFSSKKE